MFSSDHDANDYCTTDEDGTLASSLPASKLQSSKQLFGPDPIKIALHCSYLRFERKSKNSFTSNDKNIDEFSIASAPEDWGS